MLPAGLLNSRITIKARAPGQDAAGQPNGAWSVVVAQDLAAQFIGQPVSVTAEQLAGGAEISTVTCTWRIRWRHGITSGMRVEETVLGATTVWDIRQVNPNRQLRDRVDLACVAGASGG